VIFGEWLALAVIALAVGFFIGAVGVGGILLIPTLVWLGGMPIHQATATALFSFLFTGLAGTWLFQRRGSIDWNITRPVLAGALIFSYLGARVNAMVNASALTLIIALMIVFAGVYILLPARREQAGHRDGRSRRQQLLLLIVGAFAGFGSGLCGAGGPLFSVPMMLALVSPSSPVGAKRKCCDRRCAIRHRWQSAVWLDDFSIAAWITLFELLGVLLGARAAHAASVTVLRRTAAGLCVLTGLLMLARSL
jgi:uncharacterized membrane protein YfcA